jgi:hypothetical protein
MLDARFPVLLSLILAPATASAAGGGWYARQVDKSPGEGRGGQGAEIFYQGGKIRIDQGQDTTVIYDMRSGLMTVLTHREKSYLQQTLEDLAKMRDGMMKQLKAQLPQMPPAVRAQLEPKLKQMEAGVLDENKPKATGKKSKVGTYGCEIYSWSSEGNSGEFCLTRELDAHLKEFAKDTEVLAKKLAELKLGGAQGPGGFTMLEMARSGFPVRTHTKLTFNNQTIESISEVEEFKPMAIAADKFAIPAGYTKKAMPNPQLGPGLGAPPSQPVPPTR